MSRFYPNFKSISRFFKTRFSRHKYLLLLALFIPYTCGISLLRLHCSTTTPALFHNFFYIVLSLRLFLFYARA